MISGRGSNMMAILKAIQTGIIRNVVPEIVISSKANAGGLEYAKQFGIPTVVFQNPELREWAYDSQIANLLDDLGLKGSSSLICLAGYMRILSKQFVDKYNMRIVNVHPSLLPSFPGLNAQKQAIEYGVKVSGCTVHLVDAGIDTGRILMQKAVRVYINDTPETLSERILKWEHIIYPKTINSYLNANLKTKMHRPV
jgi:phosphoribosylglycinamide formyltransferase-1